MLKMRKNWLVFLVILVAAGAFRIAVAHWLPSDAPNDGRTYAQIARNVLEQHVYSHETEAPYDPSLIRLPGYPLFLAAIYSVFGHTNNGVVRIIQTLIDTGTCALVALLAFYWQPDEKRKRATAIAALALAAVCPFTTIYTATILTEVPTTFLVMAMCLAATLAFKRTSTTEDTGAEQKAFKQALLWWMVAGLCGGLAVLFRPDSGLFALAIGLTLVITGLFGVPPLGGITRKKNEPPEGGTPNDQRSSLARPAHSKVSRTLAAGALFSLAFMLVLVPWTIRNARVFHLFQPLSPSHAEMPGEFVPRGYNQWLRTWVDDEAYVEPFMWTLNTEPIDIDDLPPSSFDSAEEKARVAALFDLYNNPPDESDPAQPQATPTTPVSPSPSPARAKAQSKSKPKTSPEKSSQQTANANSNANSDEEDDENDNSSDQGDDRGNGDNGGDESAQSAEDQGSVEMTPEIDAGFAQIARERIARHPFRYYVWLPLKRAHTMWFDTHSQYWPFEGTLLPLEDLDYGHYQQIWLPLFAVLTGIYTLLGLAGAWVLWISRKPAGRRWLLLVSLAVVLRLILFASMENPEPRYLVEFFPFLAVLGGIGLASLPILIRPQINTDSHK